MSKLTDIEAALRQIDQAGFQRLGDTYLRRIGYSHLNPIGIAFGRDKTTTGTPDTLVARDDGQYVFVEYTTEATGVASKFEDDLAKCFDEAKTGIPVSRIDEVVLCHNRKLTPAEDRRLADLCRAKGVGLRTIGLGYLAHELYEKYPTIARDFLGIEVDSGQILRAPDFIEACGRNTLATPLDTDFQGRDTETGDLTTALETSPVVIVSGRPGVGKTRLALQAAARYADAHADAQIWCVLNRGADLFYELRGQFAAPGHYIILTDDANRLTQFAYVLDLLHDDRPDRTVKIIATVRDYAARAVQERAAEFGASVFELQRLSDADIRKILTESLGIHHPAYLERMEQIAEGNPRLAMMAGRIAAEQNTLGSINDVSAVYHEYFSSIRRDIEALRESAAIQIGGIVAFLRYVDRSNRELMSTICDTFDIDESTFWRTVARLHDVEAFDLHENEVVKVSDQVLATYLFYVAVFEHKTLNLTTLLQTFFPQFRQRFIDALNAVAGALDERRVSELTRPAVRSALQTFRQRGDDAAARELLDAFAPLIPAEALLACQRAIEAMTPEPHAEPVVFEPSNNAADGEWELRILNHFADAGPDNQRIALELIAAYLAKRPAAAPIIVRLVNESFGIGPHSYLSGFSREQAAARTLAGLATPGGTLAARLFLAFARSQLAIRFHRVVPKRGLTLAQYQFTLQPTADVLALRELIWKEVDRLAALPELRPDILALLRAYPRGAYGRDGAALIAAEADAVAAFFARALDPARPEDVSILRMYRALLERFELAIPAALEAALTGPTFELQELLLDDLVDRAKLGWKEANQLRDAAIAEFAATLTADTLRDTLGRIAALHEHSHDGRDKFRVSEGAMKLLSEFSKRAPSDAADIVIETAHAGNPLQLFVVPHVEHLLKVLGPEAVYQRLTEEDYPGRAQWVSAFFTVAPMADVITRVSDLVELFRTTPVNQLPWRLDVLSRLRSDAADAVRAIVTDLLARAENDVATARFVGQLLPPMGDLFSGDDVFFRESVALAKQTYFVASSAGGHPDHAAEVFDALTSADDNFPREWVAWQFSRTKYLNEYDDDRDYSILWRRPDAEAVLEQIVDAVAAAGEGRFLFGSYLSVFFPQREGSDLPAIRARQDAFLDAMIRKHFHEMAYIGLLFGVVRGIAESRRRDRLATFLSCNTDFKDFERIDLDPYTESWSGSAVPMYQRKVEFYESLLPMMNSAALIEHRQYVASRIEGLRSQIEREKKRDFMREY